LNYLTPTQLHATLKAVSRNLRVGGWFVFDLHTDAMMAFTAANPVVRGNSDGHDFSIASVVDVSRRTCDTRIHVTRTADADVFTEHHRQYFFTDQQVRNALLDAGFEILSVTEEYSHHPADAATLRATWTARRVDHETTAEFDPAQS
jgi:hypothetical protein